MGADKSPCLFCEIPRERIRQENDLAYAVRDAFPVTELHSLVIPRRHAVDYFSLTRDEVFACDQLIREVRAEILNEDASVCGFNLGVNNGAVAGQTVFHCHFHLIPRREGDVVDPRGGVRHLIPGKGAY
jgi:ATP adenylyltransferase